MQITRVALSGKPVASPLLAALAGDLHGESGKKALASLEEEKPDLILMPGDVFDLSPDMPGKDKKRENSAAFLESAGKIAPCFFSAGNHEWIASDALRAFLKERNVVLLDDEFKEIALGENRILVGGLTSPCGRAGTYSRWHTQEPNVAFLKNFSSREGMKILLCHHPELYTPFIRDLPIDLTVAGHAHGGQFRFFGKGLFAPGQGVFPALTGGVYDDRLVVTRGLGNGTPFPRLFNPRELVYIEIRP
ncbi:MAG: metallophosphoesterase [Clostridia bacterium]|nr:metallophosphoesterase [Clostridia bacterium]